MSQPQQLESLAVKVEATIRRDRHRISVKIVASDELDRIVGAVQSTFANSPQARREAMAWCRRKGVTHYTIKP